MTMEPSGVLIGEDGDDMSEVCSDFFQLFRCVQKLCSAATSSVLCIESQPEAAGPYVLTSFSRWSSSRASWNK